MPKKHILIIAALLFGALAFAGKCSAQKISDPTAWTYSAKRKFGNHFELFFKVKLSGGWHVYALDPGGDESLIPPTFTFEADKNVKLVGKMKELGKPVTEMVDGIDKAVHYFKGEATFVQEVEVPWGMSVQIKGKHEYQVCNDKMCLPPKSKAFLFTVKP